MKLLAKLVSIFVLTAALGRAQTTAPTVPQNTMLAGPISGGSAPYSWQQVLAVIVGAWANTESTLIPGSTVTQALISTPFSQNAKVTLAQNATLAFGGTGIYAGAFGNLRVIQGGSGSYTLALPSNSRVNGSTTTVTLLTSIGAENILAWYCPDGTNLRWTVGTY